MRIIDEVDVEWVNSLKLRYLRGYEGKSLIIYLHDLVICPEVREHYLNLIKAIKRHRANGVVDHINRNHNDHRRENLRYTTQKINCLNRTKPILSKGIPCSSRYIGVAACSYKHKKPNGKKWTAYLKHPNGKRIQKYFYSEKEAALWRNSKMIEHYPNEHFELNKIEAVI